MHSWYNHCLSDTLGDAQVDSNTVLDAGSSVLLAVTMALFKHPVSCIPCHELTYVLDAPESNMAWVIVSCVASALICFDS